MKENIHIKKLLPHLLMVTILFIISLIYFYPVLEGKVIQQSDIQHFKGMSKELKDFREANHEEALWTGSMFSGMPGYMISVLYKSNITKYIHYVITKIFPPASILFLYMLGFYILLISLGTHKSRWLSLVGAIAFGFSSYFLIIIAAGHNTKAFAIGYLPIVIAGVLLTFRGKRLGGALLFTVALSLELVANHLQITYYGLIMLLVYVIVELVYAIKEKNLSNFWKSIAYLLVGAILAIGMNFSRLYTNWEYSKDTIRGKSELTSNTEVKTSGLDKDYVVQWSYGIDETLTLLIPNFKGGATQVNPGLDSESYEALRKQGVQNPRQAIKGVSMYFGTQPMTSGPVYAGAIVLLLFILGLFVVKGRLKWWLLIATIISIILSWGGNVMGLTSFLLDYLPLYNKFRTPSMILVIAEITIPLLGFIALQQIISGKIEKKEWLNSLKWSVIITGGICLIIAIMPSLAGSFVNPADATRYPNWLIDAMENDRRSMLVADAIRSLIFIILATSALYLWSRKNFKSIYIIGILGVLILVDLYMVDKRYLNSDNFVSKRQAENPFPIMPVDQSILQDKDISYRVVSLQNPWSDARASYYHKSIGGYHAAKLRRYQDLIDRHLTPELQQLIKGLQAGESPEAVFNQLSTLNMLNTRYFIYDLNSAPLKNESAFGNAWFISQVIMADNADEEINTLKDMDLEKTAVVDVRFKDQIKANDNLNNKDGSIELTSYQPNHLIYDSNASEDKTAIFSEIFYDKGWEAYIDGELVPHFRANYVLRGLNIPKGEHKVEFKFKPKSYYLGNTISLISSILLVLFIVFYFWTVYKRGGAKIFVNEEKIEK